MRGVTAFAPTCGGYGYERGGLGFGLGGGIIAIAVLILIALGVIF